MRQCLPKLVTYNLLVFSAGRRPFSSAPELQFFPAPMPPTQAPERNARLPTKNATKSLKRKRYEEELSALENRVKEFVCHP